MINKKIQRKRRHVRIRAKVKGTAEAPRLSVFRSNMHIYAQLINDTDGKTLVALSDLSVKETKGKSGNEKAKLVGSRLAEEARKKKISKVVFDRSGFKYTGNIKMLAEALRGGGLVF